eukprot:gene31187-6332_t
MGAPTCAAECDWLSARSVQAHATFNLGTKLQDWVLDSGGYVHEALELTETSPCGGGRGMVAVKELDLESATGAPLILVPDELTMSTAVARYGFQHYESQGAPPMAELDLATQLAMLLAHERVQGEESFYAPYVLSLPGRIIMQKSVQQSVQQSAQQSVQKSVQQSVQKNVQLSVQLRVQKNQAPCAWACEGDELDIMLKNTVGSSPEKVEAWRSAILSYRQSMLQHAEGAAERYKKYFPLTPECFFWAMGQVLSRSFATADSDLVLLPFVDMLNHKAGADHPELINIGGDEEDRAYCVGSMAYATSGDPITSVWAPMAVGDELYIRYNNLGPSQGKRASELANPGGGDATPSDEALLSLLSYGFVPPELLK